MPSRAWREAGVNRLSLGAQSFDDRVLAWMHRTHDAVSDRRAPSTRLRDGGIDNLSLDLIFALPDDVSTRSGATTSTRALALEPTHVSLYGLTVEPHTPLGRWRDRGERHRSRRTSATRQSSCYAHDALDAAGFEHYEVSNYAPAGRARRATTRRTGGACRTPASALPRTASTARAGAGTSRHTPNGCGALARGEDPIEGEELLTAENRLRSACISGCERRDGLVLRAEKSSARSALGRCRMGDASSRRSAAADAARLAAARRARRRLDTRPKSLLDLNLWHPRAQQTRTPRPRGGDPSYVETAEPAGSRMIVAPVRARRVAGDHPQHDERPGGEGISLPPAHVGRARSDGQGVPRLRRLAACACRRSTPSSASASPRSSSRHRHVADRDDPASRRADARRADAGARRRARPAARAMRCCGGSSSFAVSSERLLLVLHARRRRRAQRLRRSPGRDRRQRAAPR